jgi:hypothetical protein
MVFDGRYKLVAGYDTETDPQLTGSFSKAYAADYADRGLGAIDHGQVVTYAGDSPIASTKSS